MPDRLQALPVMAPDLGLISGAPAHLIPDRGWATVNNGRFRRGKAEKISGYEKSQVAALNDRIMGLFEFTKSDGVFQAWIAVTNSKVYKREPSDSAFVDITGGTPLTGGDTDWVDFTIFKDVLIITNGKDNVKKWTGTGNIADLGGSPPKARRVTTFQNHVMLANLDPAGTPQPQTMQWSDLGLSETWVGGEAGSLTIVDEPSALIEIMPLRDSLIAYKNDAVYVVDYTGFPFTMSTRRLATGCGPIASRIVVDVRDAHYFISTDNQIYKLTLAGPEPVGQSARIALFDELNQNTRDRAFGFLNDPENEVHFCIPTSGTDDPRMVYFLAYLEEKWGRRALAATAAAPKGVQQLSDITWDSAVGSWDAQTLTWDDTRQTAGANLILHGNDAGYVFSHGAAVTDADGVAIDADLYTKVYDFGDPIRNKRVERIHIFYEQQPATTLDVYVLTREAPTGTATSNGPFQIVLDGTGDQWIDVNLTARWFQLRIRNNQLAQPFRISGYDFQYYLREMT